MLGGFGRFGFVRSFRLLGFLGLVRLLFGFARGFVLGEFFFFLLFLQLGLRGALFVELVFGGLFLLPLFQCLALQFLLGLQLLGFLLLKQALFFLG